MLFDNGIGYLWEILDNTDNLFVRSLLDTIKGIEPPPSIIKIYNSNQTKRITKKEIEELRNLIVPEVIENILTYAICWSKSAEKILQFVQTKTDGFDTHFEILSNIQKINSIFQKAVVDFFSNKLQENDKEEEEQEEYNNILRTFEGIDNDPDSI